MTPTRTVHSQDMRTLFQKHRKDGKTMVWIADVLNIALGTLQTWRAELKRTGSLKDRRFGNSTKQKKFSDEALILYVEEYVNATLKDIGNHFSVSDVAILKRLRNMNYSYKKKRGHTERGMQNTEMLSKSS